MSIRRLFQAFRSRAARATASALPSAFTLAYALACALSLVATARPALGGEPRIVVIDGRTYIARGEPDDSYQERPEYKNLRSPIVQLGSTYANEGTGAASVTLGGSGIVAGIQSGHFSDHPTPVVMTAAHLIHGKDPWVVIDGKRVPAEVMIASPERDVAFLRAPGLEKIPPAFVVNDSGVEPQPLLGWRLQCLAGHAKPIAANRDPVFRTCPDNIPESERLKEVQFLPPVDQDSLPRGIVLSPSWASEGSESGVLATGIRPEFSGTLPWVYPAPVLRGFDGMTNLISARVTPGNSGSLAVDPAGRYVFLGIPVLYNHYFHQSTLAGPKAFTSLGRAYWNGNHGSLTSSRWVMRNGLLHLRLADGTLDADFNRVPTGQGLGDPTGGVSAPPGGVSAPPGGVSAPPGGVSAPPGGVSAPPGEPCAPKTAESAETRLARQTRAVIAKLAPADPRELYRSYGITPFMSSGSGRRIYGYSVVHNRTVQKFTLYPNVEAWRFIQTQGSDPTYSVYPPLAEAPSFPELIAQKREIPLSKFMTHEGLRAQLAAGGSISGTLITYPGNPPHPAGSNGFVDASPAGPPGFPADRERRDVVDVTWNSGGVRIDWKLLRARPGAKSPQGEAGCLDGTRDFSVHDRIVVDLDAQGRLPGRATFEPVVRVAGASGAEYYLDLRPLFYTDLSIAFPSTARAGVGVSPEQTEQSLTDFAGQTGLILREASPDAGGYATERFVEFNETETRDRQMKSYGCTRR